MCVCVCVCHKVCVCALERKTGRGEMGEREREFKTGVQAPGRRTTTHSWPKLGPWSLCPALQLFLPTHARTRFENYLVVWEVNLCGHHCIKFLKSLALSVFPRLFVPLSVCECLCLFLSLSASLSLFLCRSLCLRVSLSVSVPLSLPLFLCLFLPLCVRVSLCPCMLSLPVSLSLSPSVYLCATVSLSVPVCSLSLSSTEPSAEDSPEKLTAKVYEVKLHSTEG